MKFSLPSTSVCYIRLVSVVYFACPRLAVMDLIYKLAVNCLPPVHQAKLNTLLNCFSHNSECTYNVNAYSYAYVCQHNSQYIAVLLVKENHTPTKNVHDLSFAHFGKFFCCRLQVCKTGINASKQQDKVP